MYVEYPSQTRIEDMLALLLAVCGGEISALFSRETYEPLADVFELTQAQRAATRDDASGRDEGRTEPHWHNLVQWARRGLRSKRYLDRARHGVWMLSPKGRERADWLMRVTAPELVAVMKTHCYTQVPLRAVESRWTFDIRKLEL